MKKFVTGLMVAATLGGALAFATGAEAQGWRRHHHHGGGGGDAAAAAALGIVGGLIVGSAIANANQPDYYDDEYVVRRAPPRRVYYEDDYRPARRGAHCRTLIKYDMYGKPYEYKDCDP